MRLEDAVCFSFLFGPDQFFKVILRVLELEGKIVQPNLVLVLKPVMVFLEWINYRKRKGDGSFGTLKRCFVIIIICVKQKLETSKEMFFKIVFWIVLFFFILDRIKSDLFVMKLYYFQPDCSGTSDYDIVHAKFGWCLENEIYYDINTTDYLTIQSVPGCTGTPVPKKYKICIGLSAQRVTDYKLSGSDFTDINFNEEWVCQNHYSTTNCNHNSLGRVGCSKGDCENAKKFVDFDVCGAGSKIYTCGFSYQNGNGGDQNSNSSLLEKGGERLFCFILLILTLMFV